MQEHTPKIVRISILLCLMLAAILSPFLIREYERHTAFQWEKIVQPHWDSVVEQSSPVQEEIVVMEEDAAKKDVPEWADISTQGLDNVPVETVPAEKAPAKKPLAKKQTPQDIKNPEKKVSPKIATRLKLKVPDNLYQGQTAEWEEKPHTTVPDFFAPKVESPSRFQLGGRIIVDEEKKKQQPDAGYLDTVKGAEINISISTP